jgi:hypothetical protein
VQNSPRVTSRRLRTFATIIAALSYCVQKAGRLFVLVWFPCALGSVCLIGVEWLVYGFPPRLPQWLIFNAFHPPSWLTPVVIATFAAVAWAFVLSDVCDRNPERGIVIVSDIRVEGVRFELSLAILVGASILLVTDLLDGFLDWAQLRLFVIVYPLFEGGDVMAETWAHSAIVLRLLAVNVVAAWTYPIAAQLLRTGVLDRASLHTLMRGNRLRLAAIFFLINVAFYQLNTFVRPAKNWIVRSSLDDLGWTPREALLRYALEFPIDVFWTAAWAVTIAIVMKALAVPAPSAEPTSRTTA